MAATDQSADRHRPTDELRYISRQAASYAVLITAMQPNNNNKQNDATKYPMSYLAAWRSG